MKTLTVTEAAELLHMHEDTVSRRARSGEIPSSKPGKRRVFIEVDLIEWLRAQYSTQNKVTLQCLSTNRPSLRTGGLTSSTTDKELESLLARPTKPPRKSTTITSRPISGAKAA